MDQDVKTTSDVKFNSVIATTSYALGNTTVSAPQWNNLTTMDQDVKTTDDVKFNRVVCSSDTSLNINNISILQNIEWDAVQNMTITTTNTNNDTMSSDSYPAQQSVRQGSTSKQILDFSVLPLPFTFTLIAKQLWRYWSYFGLIEETFDVTTAINLAGFTAYYVNSGTTNDRFEGTGGTQILSTDLINNPSTGRDDGYRFTISTGGILTLEYTANNGSTWTTVNINGTTTEFSRTIDISKKYYIFFFDTTTSNASFRFELYGDIYAPPRGKSDLFNYTSFESASPATQITFNTLLNNVLSTTDITNDTTKTDSTGQISGRQGSISSVKLDFTTLTSDMEFIIYVNTLRGNRILGGIVSDEWSMGGPLYNNANSFMVIQFTATNDRAFFRSGGGGNVNQVLNTNIPTQSDDADRGKQYSYKYKITTSGVLTLDFSSNSGGTYDPVFLNGTTNRYTKTLDTTKKYHFICYDDWSPYSFMRAQIAGSIPPSPFGRLCDVSVSNNVYTIGLESSLTSTTERYGLRSNVPFKPEDYDIMEFIFEVKTFTDNNLYLGFIHNTADLSTNLDISSAGTNYRFKCVSIGNSNDKYIQRNPNDVNGIDTNFDIVHGTYANPPGYKFVVSNNGDFNIYYRANPTSVWEIVNSAIGTRILDPSTEWCPFVWDNATTPSKFIVDVKGELITISPDGITGDLGYYDSDIYLKTPYEWKKIPLETF